MGRRTGENGGEERAHLEHRYKQLLRGGVGRTRAIPNNLTADELAALRARWDRGQGVELEHSRIRTLPVAARIARLERKLDELGLLEEASGE